VGRRRRARGRNRRKALDGWRRGSGRRSRKINKRIQRIRRAVHGAIARDIEAHYDVVLLPTLDTARLVRRDARSPLQARTKMDVRLAAHSYFREYLNHRASRTPTLEVHKVNEDYTSKTCSVCYNYNQRTLQVYSEFVCEACGYRIGRDRNSAVCILVRHTVPPPPA
jgi:putative transposase